MNNYRDVQDQSFNVGARIGASYWDSINYSYGLALLTIQSDQLLIKTFFKQRTIPRTKITGISVYKGFISKGFKICHSDEDFQVYRSDSLPPFIVLWTMRVTKIGAALRNAGYPVNTDT